MKKILFSLFASAALAASASAQLVITEVMSNSDHPGGTANGDWWELTNTGLVSINLDGYYWDDDGPSGDDGALFPNISILAGQSIVIVEENASNVAGFVAAWGGGFTAISEDDFGGPDAFSGLSASGDQIQLWDADPNAGPANLVAEVTFGTSTNGVSFEWDTSGNSLGLSVAGENGAYVAPGDGASGVGTDIGSPGAIPEPGFYGALVGLAAVGFALYRRRKA